jgi:hypothetical protein
MTGLIIQGALITILIVSCVKIVWKYFRGEK